MRPSLAWVFGPVGFVALAGLARAAGATAFDLLADEAYHWTWSSALAWGYYDQPPLVAAGIRAGRVLGETPLAVRLPGLLWALAGTLALLTAPLPGRPTDRALAGRVLLAAPPFAFLGTLAVPDAYLLGSWTFGLAAALRGRWVAVGVAGALATLSKHDGLALFPLIWAAAADRWSRGALLAALVHGALLAPHVAWLAGHGWVTVDFQLHEGLASAHPPGLLGPARVLGEQLALVPAGLALPFALRADDPVDRLALATSVPVFAFFAVAALFAPPEAHWPAPAWVGAALLLARATGPARRLADLGSWLGVFGSAALAVHVAVPLVRLPRDPATRFTEGRAIGEVVAGEALPAGVAPREPAAASVPTVFTERYQEAALITWETGIPAEVHPGCGRRSQVDLGAPEAARRAALPPRLLFVRPARSGPPPACVAPRAGALRRTREHDPRGRALPPLELGWLGLPDPAAAAPPPP